MGKNNWPVKSLGEVCDIVRGSSPRPKSDKRFYGGDIPRLMVADLTRDGMYVTPRIDFLTKEGSKLSREMKAGDVVIAVSGNPGLTAILNTDAYIHDGFVGLRNLNQSIIYNKYIYHFLTSLKIENKSQAVGAIFKNLRTDQIKLWPIPLPTLPIQKQIAEILEQADKAKQKRKEANKLTDEFLQSVFIEMFGDPIKNPKGWNIIHFGEIISILMDYHSNGSYETLRDNVKLLDTPDYAYMIRTTDLEKKDYEKNVKYISKSAYEFLTKSKIFGGEIIMNKIGSAGQVYFMPYLNRKISLGMNQFGLRFSEQANNVFIYYLLKSNYGASIINKKVQGAVTKTITKEAVRGLLIPLPPLKLQQQFAEIVNKTEALKEKQKQSEQELENLFQSLMQKAFKGELV